MFDYRSYTSNVLFGKGTYSEFLRRLQDDHTLLLISSERMSSAISELKNRADEKNLIHFSKIEQHVPRPLVDEVKSLISSRNIDRIIAIGGGSAIGLAKAIALDNAVPIAAVPSTYSGSEQTNIWGISSDVGKTTGRSDNVLPDLVVYDPDFTSSLPKPLAVKSAMNAMAHLMEAIYAPDSNPITTHVSLLGMDYISKGLDEISNEGTLTESANENLMMGAWLAGKSLCEVSMSLHHKTAHVLGGSFGMDHASVHTVLQPYVLQYQWPFLEDEIKQKFISVFGDNPPVSLKKMADIGGVESDLNSIGFDKSDISAAVDMILANPYSNVAPLKEDRLTAMLESAWEGKIRKI